MWWWQVKKKYGAIVRFPRLSSISSTYKVSLVGVPLLLTHNTLTLESPATQDRALLVPLLRVPWCSVGVVCGLSPPLFPRCYRPECVVQRLWLAPAHCSSFKTSTHQAMTKKKKEKPSPSQLPGMHSLPLSAPSSQVLPPFPCVYALGLVWIIAGEDSSAASALPSSASAPPSVSASDTATCTPPSRFARRPRRDCAPSSSSSSSRSALRRPRLRHLRQQACFEFVFELRRKEALLLSRASARALSVPRDRVQGGGGLAAFEEDCARIKAARERERRSRTCLAPRAARCVCLFRDVPRTAWLLNLLLYEDLPGRAQGPVHKMDPLQGVPDQPRRASSRRRVSRSKNRR